MGEGKGGGEGGRVRGRHEVEGWAVLPGVDEVPAGAVYARPSGGRPVPGRPACLVMSIVMIEGVGGVARGGRGPGRSSMCSSQWWEAGARSAGVSRCVHRDVRRDVL